MNKVVVVGSSNTDMVIKAGRLPAPGETILGGDFIMNPGGKGANQAVAAAKLDAEVGFVARVGDDLFGEEAVRGYRSHGINVDLVSIDPNEPTGIALIMVDKTGENCIAVASGANLNLGVAEIDAAADRIASADVVLLQLEIPLETVRYAARLGRKSRRIVMLNPAPAQPLDDDLMSLIDVITPNEIEAEMLTGICVQGLDDAAKAAEALVGKGIATVIITMSSRGAFVMDKAFTGLVPACEVDAVDTTAAGDTFNGALAVALSKGLAIADATAFAVKAATFSVTRLGAQASAPSVADLESFREK